MDVTTQACLEQRQELDRMRERNAREREEGDWELEPHLQEDRWAE
jgi:hypothetical protein